jgi:hypothetical protein
VGAGFAMSPLSGPRHDFLIRRCIMAEDQTRRDSAEAAAIQGASRTSSITPQGQALNADRSIEDRVKAVPKTEGDTGEMWQGDARRGDPDDIGGFGTLSEATHPADLNHAGGDPMLDGDAQYGASPLRTARYDEDHRVNDKHFAEGKIGVQPALHKGPAPDRDR